MTEQNAGGAGFALLHGAGLGGWVWEPMKPHLAWPCLPLDLPALRGAKDPARGELTLDDVAASVARDIATWGHQRVILVAHSLAGALAPGVAARIPAMVDQLVFVGGAVPAEGCPAFSVLPPGQRALLSVVLRWAPALSSPGGSRGPWAAIQRAGLRGALCGDLDAGTAARVVREFVPAAPRLYRDPVTWGAPRRAGGTDTPRHYVKLLRDRSGLSPDRQERIIATIGVPRVHVLDAGHLPMLSQPGELADVLNRVRS